MFLFSLCRSSLMCHGILELCTLCMARLQLQGPKARWLWPDLTRLQRLCSSKSFIGYSIGSLSIHTHSHMHIFKCICVWMHKYTCIDALMPRLSSCKSISLYCIGAYMHIYTHLHHRHTHIMYVYVHILFMFVYTTSTATCTLAWCMYVYNTSTSTCTLAYTCSWCDVCRYIAPENVPLRYGGLSRPNDTEFENVEAPVKEVTVKAGEKQTIELAVEEVSQTSLCLLC